MIEFKVNKNKDNPTGIVSLETILSSINEELSPVSSNNFNIVLNELTNKIKTLTNDIKDLKLNYESRLENLTDIKEDVNLLLNKPAIDFNSEVLKAINTKQVFTLNTPIEINSLPSIEKKSNVKIGTFYRDSVNNRCRILMKEGWKTITLED